MPKYTVDGSFFVQQLSGIQRYAREILAAMDPMLEPGEQHAEYFHIVSMLAGSLPELTGILDVSNGRRYTRAELDAQFLAPDAVPNDEFVWTITAISPDEGDESPVMLFTTGLARCGLPELELLEVPGRHAQTAAVLMNHVASLLLEEAPPAPGKPMEIGPDIDDPVARLHAIATSVKAAKAERAALGTDLFEDRAGHTPPRLYPTAIRLWASTHLANHRHNHPSNHVHLRRLKY